MSNSNFSHEITLPSRGLLNPEIPEGKVVQRCMMVSDQKFLTGAKQSAGSALHTLIEKTIESPEGFNVSNLTPSDTLYLLFKLRSISYGDTYKFKTRCPECGKKIEISIDLSELDVETLEEGFADKLVVELPHRGDKVYTKLVTNKDIEATNEELKRRKRRNPEDESEYILRIIQCIEKVELKGEKTVLTHPIDLEKYISSLTDLDASAIIAARDSVYYGIAPVVERRCPECREYIDISVQFSGDFFRPTFSK